MSTRHLGRLLTALALLFAMSGCLFIDDHPDSKRQGFTYCGDFLDETYCQPGQYCEDATFSKCEPGCLSSANCSDDQVCVKSNNQDIGTCQNKGKQTPPPNGTTSCGERGGEPVMCQAGQYCESPTFGRCELGCLSNANCAIDQSCVKAADQNVGTCQNS